MTHDHHHHDRHLRSQNEKRLLAALVLTGLFLIVEVAGGLIASSLALPSDAGHMFTDVAGLAIALIAMRIARRPANPRKTYGYYRLEILASAVNAGLLFLVGFYILFEAWRRLFAPPEIHTGWMLGIAVLGLFVNYAGMRLVSDGKDTSLNIKGAYLELWSDFLGSVGVIVAAVFLHLTGWTWIDTAAAILIGAWVFPRSWKLLGESINILLQGVPAGVAVTEIETDLLKIPGVMAVHNLHVWSLTSGRNVVTAHVVTTCVPERLMPLRKEIERLLEDQHHLHISTIQLEDESGACEERGRVANSE